MQALELKYGIYDTITKTWLLFDCEEKDYEYAVRFADMKNYMYNGRPKKPKKGQIPPEQVRRYVVKAKGGRVGNDIQHQADNAGTGN